MENCWIGPDEQCLYTAPEGEYGYIYKITTPSGPNGDFPHYYWGKKALIHQKKVKLSKKARKASDNPRKRISKEIKESDWLSYYGSSIPLKQWIEKNGTDQVKREILLFVKNKIDLTYWEMAILVFENALFREDCWNSNVLSKFFKGRVSNISNNQIITDNNEF